MAEKYFSSSRIYSISWPLTPRNDPTETFLDQIKPPMYWRWTVPLNYEQIRLGALSKLQMRNIEANGRPRTSFLSPMPPSNRDTRFGGSRRWHCALVSVNSTQHLMTQNFVHIQRRTLLNLNSFLKSNFNYREHKVFKAQSKLDQQAKDIRVYYKSKFELKSNSSEILPVNCKFICIRIFFFALKVRLKNLKFEFCQFKLE